MRICFLRFEEPLEEEELIRNLGKVDLHAPVGDHPVSHGPLAATTCLGTESPCLHQVSLRRHRPGQTPEMSAATGTFRFSRKG